jgi:hypothetical protein
MTGKKVKNREFPPAKYEGLNMRKLSPIAPGGLDRTD